MHCNIMAKYSKDAVSWNSSVKVPRKYFVCPYLYTKRRTWMFMSIQVCTILVCSDFHHQSKEQTVLLWISISIDFDAKNILTLARIKSFLRYFCRIIYIVQNSYIFFKTKYRYNITRNEEQWSILTHASFSLQVYYMDMDLEKRSMMCAC